ncbi:MAG: hypothetical protein M0P58_07990 [Bacteroidales bacterium]|jgi:hypothetical protein|nr:hypothetical protein [Bacteroidales bacterium]
MSKRSVYSILTLFILLFLSACGGDNKELKKDAKNIADAMCKSIETMNSLRAANPGDSILVGKLQKDVHNNQIEMTILYDEFKKKYGEKAKTEKFNKEFARYLRESMLDCKALSKEDRKAFEKELSN